MYQCVCVMHFHILEITELRFVRDVRLTKKLVVHYVVFSDHGRPTLK